MHETKVTVTSRGPIPHLEYAGIRLPVQVTMTRKQVRYGDLPDPVIIGWQYVYALPGGGAILGLPPN